MADWTRRILISSFMAVFISVVQLYTWITLPLYFLLQKPWIQRARSNRKRTRILNFEDSVLPPAEEESLSPVYSREDSGVYNHKIFDYETMSEMFDEMIKMQDPNRPCLGFRHVLSEEISYDDKGKVRRVDGRQLKRYRLSDYKWLTYSQLLSVTKNMAQGFISKGITKDEKILIISETRIEWMLCFASILRTGNVMVTVFSNLGVDGVAHAVEETEVQTVISSIECLPMLKAAIKSAKNSKIKRIIYMDGYNQPELELINDVEISPLSNIEQLGRKVLMENQNAAPFHKPKLDDVTVIMYTSGTTGTPKAASLSHRNFIAVLKALFPLVREIMHTAPYHTYISYLPMAHVLELTLEIFFFLGGVKLGYASPFTLTDSAPGLCKGEKSDIKLLKPTVMTTVPLVLDRIMKEVNDKLRARTPVSQPVFHFLIDYKSKWTQLGYRCDLVTKLLCPKVREQLGGNLLYMICGGAPLHAHTQASIKSALDVTLIQGYGATETCGAVLCMDFDDLEYGRVGAPLGQVLFRLRDWNEGGYSNKDKPNPRGEILIGGNNVSVGYFMKPELNAEVFRTDQNGIRWFHTGDIGELYPNGTIKIIDRCKDLIKLQNGEYISLGKVEAVLKSSQYVDNVCVFGGTFSNDIVALISPSRKMLEELSAKFDKNHLDIKQKCDDPAIIQAIFEDIMNVSQKAKLGKKETPKRIKLVPEEWSPDNNILTAAMKLKRRVVETTYKQELYDLYNNDNNNNSIYTIKSI